MSTVSCVYHTHDCEFGQIAPGGFVILAAIQHASQVIAHDLTITAGTNDHAIGKHPVGEAYDLRVRDLTVPQTLRLVDVLKATLGTRFTVLYETPTTPTDPALAAIATINAGASAPHVHAQVRKGTSFPPSAGNEALKV